MKIKIISGGQTGVDIGALLAAQKLGIETGGFAAKGWRTEDGPRFYQLSSLGLIEMQWGSYSERTKANVQTSDFTIILATKPESAGTIQTVKFCQSQNKPYIKLNPYDETCLNKMLEFIKSNVLNSPKQQIVINFAGNRETLSPGIHGKTEALVIELLGKLKNETQRSLLSLDIASN